MNGSMERAFRYGPCCACMCGVPCMPVSCGHWMTRAKGQLVDQGPSIMAHASRVQASRLPGVSTYLILSLWQFGYKLNVYVYYWQVNNDRNDSESIAPEGEPFRVQNPVKPWWKHVLSVIKVIVALLSASATYSHPECHFDHSPFAVMHLGLQTSIDWAMMLVLYQQETSLTMRPLMCLITAQQMLSSFFFFAVVVIEYEHFSFGQQCLSCLT